MASAASVCSICGKTLSLQDCTVDERGNALHGTCYTAQIDGALRPWRQIARELAGETNPERLAALAEELNRSRENAQLRQQPSNDYEKIVDEAVALMHSDYASIQMLFPERGSGGELRLLAFRGFNPEASQFWEWVRADSKSTCGIALCYKSRVIAADIATCNFMAGSEDKWIYLETGIRACQTTPLIGQSGNVVGMISTHWRTPHQPSEKDFRLFDILARQTADLLNLAGPMESCHRACLISR